MTLKPVFAESLAASDHALSYVEPAAALLDVFYEARHSLDEDDNGVQLIVAQLNTALPGDLFRTD
jgi:hypothetical protein